MNQYVPQQSPAVPINQQFQLKIGALLDKKETVLTQSDFKSKILAELKNFHEFYNQQYFEIKQSEEKLKHKNWEYKSKIVLYEKLFEENKYQLIEKTNTIQFLQATLQKVNQQSIFMKKAFQEEINRKDEQILQLKAPRLSSKGGNSKKVVKLRDKTKDNTPIQMCTLKTYMGDHQVSNLKNKVEELELQQSYLRQQNEILEKKIKHHEADRKYEEDRIKSSTLNLQIQLKLKNEQISRLTSQIATYETKFEQMLRDINHKNISRASEYDIKTFEDSENFRSLQERTIEESQGNCTPRETQLTKKKPSHRRHDSSNLEQNKRRRELNNQSQNKENSEIKLRVYRCFNKKKFIDQKPKLQHQLF